MDETAGFQMNPDTAIEFFERCQKRGAKTREERIIVLKELQKELRAIKLTEADLKQAIKGKNIFIIKPEEGTTNA